MIELAVVQFVCISSVSILYISYAVYQIPLRERERERLWCSRTHEYRPDKSAQSHDFKFLLHFFFLDLRYEKCMCNDVAEIHLSNGWCLCVCHTHNILMAFRKSGIMLDWVVHYRRVIQNHDKEYTTSKMEFCWLEFWLVVYFLGFIVYSCEWFFSSVECRNNSISWIISLISWLMTINVYVRYSSMIQWIKCIALGNFLKPFVVDWIDDARNGREARVTNQSLRRQCSLASISRCHSLAVPKKETSN